MKRLKKKLLIILGVAIASFFAVAYSLGWFSAVADTGEISPKESVVALNYVTAYAEDGGVLDGIIPETEASIWFEEKIMPYILEYGAAALGVLSGLLFVLGKLKKSIAGLVGAHNALKTANENNDNTKKEVQTLKTDSAAWQERQEAKMEEYFARQKKMMEERFDAIAEKVTDKLDDIGETAHKILDVEEIAYEDNPVMVSKGTSKKIAEVIHNGEKQKETHESDS